MQIYVDRSKIYGSKQTVQIARLHYMQLGWHDKQILSKAFKYEPGIHRRHLYYASQLAHVL